jgi:transcriptional regulator with XRE-family HTH domain
VPAGLEDDVRRELGGFLREKRKALGLRREDVAERAFVSYDWVVRIEQGRAHASPEVLGRVCETLKLDRTERDYVRALYREGGPPPALGFERVVPGSALRVMHAQEPLPAYILNSRMDVLAWNEVSCEFYALEWGEYPPPERNVLWLMLTNPTLRERIVDWEEHTRRTISRCRALWAGRATDPAISGFVNRLTARSVLFRQCWSAAAPEVLDMGPIRKVIVDSECGELAVEQTAWVFGDKSDHILILSSPLDEDTRRGLERLAARRRARA